MPPTCRALQFFAFVGFLALTDACLRKKNSTHQADFSSNTLTPPTFPSIAPDQISAPNHSITMKAKGVEENFYEITNVFPGFLRFALQFNSNQPGGLKPIDITLFDADKNVVSSGSFSPLPVDPKFMDLRSSFKVEKTGVKVYLLIRHHNQFNAINDEGLISIGLNNLPSASHPISITFPNYARVNERYGSGLKFEVKTGKTLSQMDLSLTLLRGDGFFYDAATVEGCKTCKGSLNFQDGAKTYNIPLVFKSAEVISVGGGLQFNEGTYPFEVKIDGIPAEALLDSYLDFGPLVSSDGEAMGFLPIQLGDTFSYRTARFNESAFGFEATLDRSVEANLKAYFSLTPIYNNPEMMSHLEDKDITLNVKTEGKIINSVVQKDDKGLHFIHDFNLALKANQKYIFEYVTPGLARAAILSLQGVLFPIPVIDDGGPPLNSFSDNGQAPTPSPPHIYVVDTKMVNDSSAWQYSSAPVHLASKSVLDSMELIRNTFHKVVPKGTKPQEWAKVDSNMVETCLANEATHWSDIMIHYYCQYGHARACYTGAIRDKTQELAPKLGDPPDPKAHPDVVAEMQLIRAQAYKACAATASTDPEWAWIVKHQSTVFQYIMNSQTFAFDMEEQQAVINKFYRINVHTDGTECLEKRPIRAIDSYDGTHCLAKKVFSKTMQAAGR